MLMHFLRGFGKVLGLDMNVDVPTLGMLQEGLLNVGDSMGQVQDLVVKLLSLAVCDPGLPPGQKVSFDPEAMKTNGLSTCRKIPYHVFK